MAMMELGNLGIVVPCMKRIIDFKKGIFLCVLHSQKRTTCSGLNTEYNPCMFCMVNIKLKYNSVETFDLITNLWLERKNSTKYYSNFLSNFKTFSTKNTRGCV